MQKFASIFTVIQLVSMQKEEAWEPKKVLLENK